MVYKSIFRKLIISMKTVNSAMKQKTLQMMKKVSLEIIDPLKAPYPQKEKLHLNLKKSWWWMRPCLSSNSKKIKCRTLTKHLVWLFDPFQIYKKKELLKKKIQEIIFQAQFGNSIAPGSICTKWNNANTANHLSYRNSNFPELTKKLACSIYFTSTNRLRRSYLSQDITQKTIKILNRILFCNVMIQINEITFKWVPFSLV